MLSPAPNTQQNKRRRVKACVPCRDRKRKCDGDTPCGMCVSYGYECRYTQGKGSSVPSIEPRGVSLGGRSLTTDVSSNVDPNNAQDIVVTSPTARAIIDPTKSKYTILHSAVAFPRSLGLELLSTNPPRLHSFAWHCGIRPQENATPHVLLSSILTKEEFERFSRVYYSVVHPIFDVVGEHELRQNAERFWNGDGKLSDYGAVVAGVVALGSFFSGSSGHPRELDIVQFAKEILDDPAFSRSPSVEQVSACILRTIYLRATARPHVAWLASCATLHLAEAIGLHHEIDKVDLATASNLPLKKAKGLSEQARRIFWCAWSINAILSYDYGRSNVVLQRITCKQVKDTDENCTANLVALAQLIPQENVTSDAATQTIQLLQALSAVHKSPDVHPFLSLTKSDVCLSFYRRLRLLNYVLDKSTVLKIIDIGNTALSAASELVKIDHAWWNVLSTSFQYICVLLAIDTPESLSHVAPAMSKFDEIVEVLGTHVAIEAQNTAKLLLQDSMKKKRQEIEQLERATQKGPLPENIHLLDIDWNTLLDPSYTLSFM